MLYLNITSSKQKGMEAEDFEWCCIPLQLCCTGPQNGILLQGSGTRRLLSIHLLPTCTSWATCRVTKYVTQYLCTPRFPNHHQLHLLVWKTWSHTECIKIKSYCTHSLSLAGNGEEVWGIPCLPWEISTHTVQKEKWTLSAHYSGNPIRKGPWIFQSAKTMHASIRNLRKITLPKTIGNIFSRQLCYSYAVFLFLYQHFTRWFLLSFFYLVAVNNERYCCSFCITQSGKC